MEINSDIPPPFMFEVIYHPSWSVRFDEGFYGASIAAIADVVEPYGYSILEVELNGAEHNVIFIRDDFVELFPDIPHDLCSTYYTAMTQYWCIHVCNPVNFGVLPDNITAVDTTKIWSSNAVNNTPDQLLPVLNAIMSRASSLHSLAVHNKTNAFRTGIISHLDYQACRVP